MWHQSYSFLFIKVNIMKKIVFIFLFCFSTLSFAELGSTIFTFDGQDFIRTETTLMDEDGNLAINTKLDRSHPGYKIMLNKKSWSGKDIVVGRQLYSYLAPLIDKDGKVAGALAVFKYIE